MKTLAVSSLALVLPVLLISTLPRGAQAAEAVRLLPGGVVYPEYNSEGRANPGTLNKDEASLVRILIEPNIFGSSTQGADLNYTLTSAKWGFDAGYGVSRTVYTGFSPSGLTHAIHGAASYRLDALGFGVGYTHFLTTGSGSTVATTSGSTTGLSGQLDLGLAYTMGRARVALVVPGINSSPSATLGVGVYEDNSHAIELNLGLPPFSGGFTSPGAAYDLLLALSVYRGPFGVGYLTNYTYAIGGGSATGASTSFLNTPLGFSHGFSLLLKFTNTGSISLRFNPNDYLTLGMTFGL